MIYPTHISGKNKIGNIVLYALSTCVWCYKTKMLLNQLNIDYSYVDVDLLLGFDREKAKEEVTKFNPRCNFPTLVINNEKCIVGFDQSEIMGLLK